MTSTPLVLLVGGRLASGKDTFADHLVEKHGFVKLGMSDILAEALYRLNPWIEQGPRPIDVKSYVSWPSHVRYQQIVDRLGYVEAKKYPEARRLLQQLGTEVGRQLLGEDIWVQGAARRIDAALLAGHQVVITGIRYENELGLDKYIKAWPAAVTSIWVDRPQELDAAAAAHSSEQLDDEHFEYLVNNYGTLEQLYQVSDAVLATIQEDFA